MVASAPAMGETAWPYPCLAPQTCSVPDFVRTELQTLRLAIAPSDRRDRAMHPSQIADGHHPSSLCEGKENEQAWREHLEP